MPDSRKYLNPQIIHRPTSKIIINNIIYHWTRKTSSHAFGGMVQWFLYYQHHIQENQEAMNIKLILLDEKRNHCGFSFTRETYVIVAAIYIKSLP